MYVLCNYKQCVTCYILFNMNVNKTQFPFSNNLYKNLCYNLSRSNTYRNVNNKLFEVNLVINYVYLLIF